MRKELETLITLEKEYRFQKRADNSIMGDKEQSNLLQKIGFYIQEEEKKLKALEIIKKKQVNVVYFNICLCLKDYNRYCMQQRELTPEEYDLLKEVFGE